MSLFQLNSRHEGLFGPLALFILITGVAFVFSMPSATYVREIAQTTLTRGTPLAFFAVYALAFTLLGLNQGASVVSKLGWGRSVFPITLGNLATALVMTTPYLVYTRIILLPLDRSAILSVAGYSFLAAISFALMGQWLEVRAVRLGRESLIPRYGTAAAVIAIPMAFHFAPEGVRLLSLISPLSAALQLHAGATPIQTLFLFLLPVVGSIAMLLLTRRERGISRVRV